MAAHTHQGIEEGGEQAGGEIGLDGRVMCCVRVHRSMSVTMHIDIPDTVYIDIPVLDPMLCKLLVGTSYV